MMHMSGRPVRTAKQIFARGPFFVKPPSHQKIDTKECAQTYKVHSILMALNGLAGWGKGTGGRITTALTNPMHRSEQRARTVAEIKRSLD
eukprot:5689645-Amphidinium_carterae.1